MSIRNRMIALACVAIISNLALTGLLLTLVSVAYHADRSATYARTVSEMVFDLTLLTCKYTASPDPETAAQWNALHYDLGELLASGSRYGPDVESLSAAVAPYHQRIDQLFSRLRTHLGSVPSVAGTGRDAYGARLSDRLHHSAAALADKVNTFRADIDRDLAHTRMITRVLALTIAAFGVGMTIAIAWWTWAHLSQPLTMLRDGALRFAAGELDYRFDTAPTNEIGEVAHAFNTMADTLHASNCALRNEVAERRAAEHALSQSKHTIELTVEQRTAELLEANRRLDEATRAKDRFMARMSHELRTPLNSIIGFTSVLLSKTPGPLGEEQERQLRMISRSGARLLSLVNDLLDISVIAAGRIDLRCEKIDLDILGERLSDAIGPIARLKQLRFEYLSPGPITIISDPQRIEQILMNLLSNAVKFTERGTVRLEITGADDGGACVVVSDTGIGMPPEQLASAFDEFTQLPMPDERVAEGVGLGLAIAKSLTEALGGTIEVTSEVGKGSSFTVRLPAKCPLDGEPLEAS